MGVYTFLFWTLFSLWCAFGFLMLVNEALHIKDYRKDNFVWFIMWWLFVSPFGIPIGFTLYYMREREVKNEKDL